MRRFKACLTILVILGVGASAAPFVYGPYSGAPSADSIVIDWSTEPLLPARVAVERADVYQATQSYGTVVSVEAPPEEGEAVSSVLVDGLPSDTWFVYEVRVQSGAETYVSPQGHFRTEPLPDEPVHFAVLADTQWQWEGDNRMKWVGDRIAGDAAELRRAGAGLDFILHAGDLVESPSVLYWDHWFASFDTMLLAAPFIPVLGNHERNHRSYYNTFAHPPGEGQNDERWWALHWGDTVVVGLDTEAGRADRIMAQQAFAERELSGPETHKFVIFHRPVFSSDAFHGSGYSYDIIYHPIFVRTGVDIVFNGHAHNYEHLNVDGVTYLVLGGGGATPRPLAPQRVPGSIVAVENHYFYAEVTTSGDGIQVTVPSVAVEEADGVAVPTPNEVLDSFFLPTVPPSPVRTPSIATVLAWIALVGIGLLALLRP